MAYPKFTIGPITMPQEWPVYRCMVSRMLPDGEVQYFDVWASSAARCHHNAADLELALNKAISDREAVTRRLAT